MDGSAEPANEILEQTAHDRPLVAQTYSAAVAKGRFSLSMLWLDTEKRCYPSLLSLRTCSALAPLAEYVYTFLEFHVFHKLNMLHVFTSHHKMMLPFGVDSGDHYQILQYQLVMEH